MRSEQQAGRRAGGPPRKSGRRAGVEGVDDRRDRIGGGQAWRTGVAHSHRTRDARCRRRKGLAPVKSRAERARVRSQRDSAGERAGGGRRAHETSIAATMIMRYIISCVCRGGAAKEWAKRLPSRSIMLNFSELGGREAGHFPNHHSLELPTPLYASQTAPKNCRITHEFVWAHLKCSCSYCVG